MKPNAYPPVIILGMHRTGTTLLTENLEALGLFVGYRKEINHEAIFFMHLNEWMFVNANARWDNPFYFRFIDDAFKENMKRVMLLHLNGRKRKDFLGWKKALKYRDIRDLDMPWGWKDPRNTFTIDVWKELFPGAKVLHIYRNPLDVAASLKKREEEWVFRLGSRARLRERRLEGAVDYIYSLRVRDIRESVRLWEEYVTKAFSLDDEFKGRILHVKYEDFLEDYPEQMKNILNFLGMEYRKDKVLETGASLKKDRKFAFLQNDSYVKIYDRIKNSDLMRRLGYHDIY